MSFALLLLLSILDAAPANEVFLDLVVDVRHERNIGEVSFQGRAETYYIDMKSKEGVALYRSLTLARDSGRDVRVTAREDRKVIVRTELR